MSRRLRFVAAICCSLAGHILHCAAQQSPLVARPTLGPYNAKFVAGGPGLSFNIQDHSDSLLDAQTAWTLSCWYKTSRDVQGLELLGGLGEVTAEYSRFLALAPGRVVFFPGSSSLDTHPVAGPAPVNAVGWHLLTATFDGLSVRLFSDGAEVGQGSAATGAVDPVLQLAPAVIAPRPGQHFAGLIAGFIALRYALSASQVSQLAQHPPAFADLMYDEGSKPWPLQTHAQAGYRSPQNPSEMPISRAPFSASRAAVPPPPGPSLISSAPAEWTFANNWTLRSATEISASPTQITAPAFDARGWLRAVVPGTVLTSLVADGIYPDPYYGLNNLAIPETLNKHGYWYRNVFTLPPGIQAQLAAGDQVQLDFAGINYRAEIWLNSTRLGEMKGAFRRGSFDVTDALRPGSANVLAVRIDPPPHPGIPQEQSILGGAGENGGAMELDGPTFLATEGWDWVPAIRDRDSGVWQPITLSVTGPLRLGDVQVISRFKNHALTSAQLEFRVPVLNSANHPISATIAVTVEGRTANDSVILPPGESNVTLAAAKFPQLSLDNPRLWWPNGYGKPELYHADVTLTPLEPNSRRSDAKAVRFGIREISYELSLMDQAGMLRRVEFTPVAAADPSSPLIDVTHEGIREIPSADAAALNIPESLRGQYPYQSFVYSLPAAAESSASLEPSTDLGTAPYLVLKVNGVRIAARGGNWGMDDAMKRVSRKRLEPYFRLDRDANMNIIRNWVGQNTEETFYELADEYGMMVWNDFWESTQNYNIEAEDPALFLGNARDTIEHYRNHPSIVLWCGRNEGVPQPILNQGLEMLARSLDGTRLYIPSSNQINLQGSGPYSYQDPALYYTTLNRGFSVETGTPSLSTLESLRNSIPEPDQWPMDDVWAYHDWHFVGNGRVQPFMHEIEVEFGAGTNLADFERKAQMLNYVDHRAIFEGMNANLWQPNSGRMLWMTQPAWPSNVWQILSSDYDTQASFYGARKGAEPLHIQLNLANWQVDVVNTTPQPRSGMRIAARVVSLGNAPLAEANQTLDISADTMVHALTLPLANVLARGVALVELVLKDASGTELSRNFYWLADQPAQYLQLGTLPSAALQMHATANRDGDEAVIQLQISNPGSTAALASKLTLFGARGERILPAYYSDNYVSLLPGEAQTLTIRVPAPALPDATLALRGWNVVPQTLKIRLPQ